VNVCNNILAILAEMSRPTCEEVIEWVKDDNVSRVREALRKYPDLISAKEKVRIVDNVNIASMNILNVKIHGN